MKEKFFLGIDTSLEQGLVCTFNQERIFFAHKLVPKMSHAKNISDAIKEVLAQHGGKKPSLIVVGVGPGSFVGVRIALATALGYACATDIAIMGICSHQALAQTFFAKNPKEESITLAMKASLGFYYVSHHLKNSQGYQEPTSTPQVLELKALKNLEHKVVATDDISAFEVAYLLKGPCPQGFHSAFLSKLLANNSLITDEIDFIKPNYVKGVNVTLKK